MDNHAKCDSGEEIANLVLIGDAFKICSRGLFGDGHRWRKTDTVPLYFHVPRLGTPHLGHACILRSYVAGGATGNPFGPARQKGAPSDPADNRPPNAEPPFVFRPPVAPPPLAWPS